ncbi:protein kinase [Streptomyces sp. NPDC050287]|uniref:protein kinase domain-containing protein n=1 Tax=Streptomyces sp. NPDC050287 TaxID=3365608 RepID=UPI00378FDC60
MSDEGRLVAGRYRLLDRIGRGGMGTVWRAHDDLLARQVAVKKLHPQPHLDDDELAVLFERTRREARSAARVSHPNVVVVHDVVVDEGLPAIVMEYVQSITLGDLIESHGPVPLEEAARIGRGVIAALRAAHRAGILHRDVKPANVLLAQGGRVVLTDFGIAQASEASALTRSGQLVGSVDFIAPERLVGAPPGPEADLWALGATLFQAVDGRSPFLRDSVTETMYAIAMEPAPEVRGAGRLTPLIQGLLAAKPAERLSAEEAENLLRVPVAGGGSAGAPPAVRAGAGDAAAPAAKPELDAEPDLGGARREVSAAGTAGEHPQLPPKDPRPKRASGWWKKPVVLAAVAVTAISIATVLLRDLPVTPTEKNSTSASVSPPVAGDTTTPQSPDASAAPSPSASASSRVTAPAASAAPPATSRTPRETALPESADGGTPSAKSGPDTSAAPLGRALVVAASGKCLSSGNGSEGTQLFQAACDGSAVQQWQIRSDGTIRSSGKCMTAAGGATEDRTEIQLAGCDGGADQQFHLAGTELAADQSQKCVDIFGGASGTGAVLFECNGRDNQTWKLQ